MPVLVMQHVENLKNRVKRLIVSNGDVTLKVVLIGVGNMGSAMVKAWVRCGTVASSDLTLFDTDPGKVEVSSKTASDQINSRISAADVVVLAIKPQDLNNAAARIAPFITANTTVLSILAGISLKKLSAYFPNTQKLVRAMPNIGARICQSMTAFVCSSALSAADKEKASKLLSGLGKVECLPSEDLMDAWCAVAGSGPGFIVFIMESLVAAAIEQGFSSELAEQMVKQTFVGTSLLAQETKQSLTSLRESVVSKGGTTEAGLQVFEALGLSDIVKQAVTSATLRGKALNI